MRLLSLLFLLIAVSVNCHGVQESLDPGDTLAVQEIDAAIREGNITLAWERFKNQAFIIGSTDDISAQLTILDKGIEICLLANNPQLANDLLRPARRMGLMKSDAMRTSGLLRKAEIHFVLGEYREMNDALKTAIELINEETAAADLAMLFACKAIHAWLSQQTEAAKQFVEAALQESDDQQFGHSTGTALLVRAFLLDDGNHQSSLIESNLRLSGKAFEREFGSVAFHALLARMIEIHAGESIRSLDETILQFASRADRFNSHWIQATGFSAKAELLRRKGQYSEALDLLQQSLDLTALTHKEIEQWRFEWERISPLFHMPPINGTRSYPVYLVMLILLLVVCMLLLLLRTRTQRIINQRLMESVEKSRIAELEAEQASRLRRQFVANVSHEIKTPMSGLVGMTSLLEELITDPRQKKYLATIRACNRNLLVLLNDLLDLARIEANKLDIENKPFLIEETITYCQEVARLNAEEKRLELIVEIDEHLPRVLVGDSTRISQIVVNLLNNAIKFTEKGTIRLAVKYDFTSEQSGNLLVRVEDTGPGFEPGLLKTVFEPFNQFPSVKGIDGTGSGLGLAICKRLTDLLGGSLTVRSETGRGSVFTLSLPLHLPDD